MGKPDWEKCESDFERDVGKIIYAKNYRLIPQYEPFGPGSYRIDFVIEGLKSRLAIECDGPHHDDPEQIERDMARQRQLERCKWVFWRVSASSFYFEREKAMDSLWRKLEELEIHPLTAAQQEATPETPPQVERPSLPKAAVPRSVAARSTQLDLVSPPQLELAAQKQMPGKAPVDASKERLAAALTYAMVSQLKRTHPGGFFTRDEICKVILAFLQDDGHMGRKDLIGKVITSLEMPEHHEKRIENALETMERDGKIMAGATTVSLIRD